MIKYAFLTFLVFASVLSASDDQHAAENVIRQAYHSIAQIEEGKIFLKPEKLCLKQGIIYVEDAEGEQFAIPVTFPSEGRPYMQVCESIIFNAWRCDCGAWNHKWDNPTHCASCNKPR